MREPLQKMMGRYYCYEERRKPPTFFSSGGCGKNVCKKNGGKTVGKYA
jgi:hypothetical protein